MSLVPLSLVKQSPAQVAAHRETEQDRRELPEVRRVSFMLDDVQKTWDRLLPAQEHIPYHHAKLVLFRNSIQSACGMARTATGPFYCPGDEKVYLDLAFFTDLKQRFGAPGEFAQAYVIAHEIGHHVQKLLGVEGKVRRLQQREPGERNPLSVKLELQADCFAGIWAELDRTAKSRGSARYRRRIKCRCRRGRRPPATNGAGLCEPRFIHARDVGRAEYVVPPGTRYGQDFKL